tara:strand:+ start:291 stop:695 length:405 start_codon:yes stop_codon:yes gene_type:complete
MRILLLTLSLLFTQELEVQGDLKVSGSIDAQNNPVKNVGVPQSLTDAINGNALQDALRETGPFEYKTFSVIWDDLNHSCHSRYKEIGSSEYIDDWESYLNSQGSNGWKVLQIIPHYTEINHVKAVVIISKETNE